MVHAFTIRTACPRVCWTTAPWWWTTWSSRKKPALKAALSADGRYLNLTLTGGSDLAQVWFPHLEQKNGQDDLQWYEAKKQADGSWTIFCAPKPPQHHRHLFHSCLRQ